MSRHRRQQLKRARRSAARHPSCRILHSTLLPLDWWHNAKYKYTGAETGRFSSTDNYTSTTEGAPPGCHIIIFDEIDVLKPRARP